MSSCCQWHSLAAVSVAYNEGKLLEKMGGGGGGSVGGVKRMPGDLCVIEVFEMSHISNFMRSILLLKCVLMIGGGGGFIRNEGLLENRLSYMKPVNLRVHIQ